MEFEERYRDLIEAFLHQELTSEDFVEEFMALWEEARDSDEAEEPDQRFQRIVERIYTSCDNFDLNPETHWGVDTEQLKAEVRMLAYVWWGIAGDQP